MALEIARRLAQDGVTWETVVADEAGGGGSLPVAAGASGNVGDVVGVVYQMPGVFVVGGVDKDTPLNGYGAVLTDAFAQWNGNGASLMWSGNGTDGEQSLFVINDAGETTLHDADGNMSPAGTVIDLPDPTNPQDAATKAYVDANVGAVGIPQGGPLTEDLDADGNDLFDVGQIRGNGGGLIGFDGTGSLNVNAGTDAPDQLQFNAGGQTGMTIQNGAVGFYGSAPTPQSPAITDVSGGVVIDTEARAALNELLVVLRALGLIAT